MLEYQVQQLSWALQFILELWVMETDSRWHSYTSSCSAAWQTSPVCFYWNDVSLLQFIRTQSGLIAAGDHHTLTYGVTAGAAAGCFLWRSLSTLCAEGFMGGFQGTHFDVYFYIFCGAFGVYMFSWICVRFLKCSCFLSQSKDIPFSSLAIVLLIAGCKCDFCLFLSASRLPLAWCEQKGQETG